MYFFQVYELTCATSSGPCLAYWKDPEKYSYAFSGEIQWHEESGDRPDEHFVVFSGGWTEWTPKTQVFQKLSMADMVFFFINPRQAKLPKKKGKMYWLFGSISKVN